MNISILISPTVSLSIYIYVCICLSLYLYLYNFLCLYLLHICLLPHRLSERTASADLLLVIEESTAIPQPVVSRKLRILVTRTPQQRPLTFGSSQLSSLLPEAQNIPEAQEYANLLPKVSQSNNSPKGHHVTCFLKYGYKLNFSTPI